MMGLFRRAPRCPHDHIQVSRVFTYLGHTSPTVRGFCVDDGKRVEFKVNGVGEHSSADMIGKAVSAMGWRKEEDGTLSRIDTTERALERRKKEIARLERELGIPRSQT